MMSPFRPISERFTECLVLLDSENDIGKCPVHDNEDYGASVSCVNSDPLSAGNDEVRAT